MKQYNTRKRQGTEEVTGLEAYTTIDNEEFNNSTDGYSPDKEL